MPFQSDGQTRTQASSHPCFEEEISRHIFNPPSFTGIAGATTRNCSFSSHGFQLNVASKRFHKHGLFSTCFFWGRRKGVAFPNSLMCISCFQCLHSTMCEVTRKKPNVAFVPVYYSRTHPTKNAWRKSPG